MLSNKLLSLKVLVPTALILGLGILVAVYFEVWIAVAILGVLLMEVLAAMYFRKKQKASNEEQTQEDTETRVTEAFGDTLVMEIMVPRPDMVTIDSSFSIDDSLDLMLFNGFSRMPVCGDGIDDIRGIVHAKDLMASARDTKGKTSIPAIMRKSNFIPETKRISELLREMQANRFHVAIAIDEYGGTAGLVTLEDLIEEIVGEITDEFDVETPLIERLARNEFRVNGRVSMSELVEKLGVEVPEGNWSTVGGFIFTTLGHIPEEGEEVTSNGNKFCVERVQGRRIARVRIVSVDDS